MYLGHERLGTRLIRKSVRAGAKVEKVEIPSRASEIRSGGIQVLPRTRTADTPFYAIW